METKLNKLRNLSNPFKVVIEDFLNDDFFSPTNLIRNGGMASTTYNPVNIKETDTSYLIELSVPGYTKEDMTISLEGGKLTVTGKHSKSETISSTTLEGYTRKEFFYSDFKRSFNLPETSNVEKISAKCENGILSLDIPKKDVNVTTPKTITIS